MGPSRVIVPVHSPVVEVSEPEESPKKPRRGTREVSYFAYCDYLEWAKSFSREWARRSRPQPVMHPTLYVS